MGRLTLRCDNQNRIVYGVCIVKPINHDDLLKPLGGKDTPTADQFRDLVVKIDSHSVLAKVFLLEGVPYVLRDSPMKYIIFREQVAERFGIGSQDVCIVGSAKLGFSPAAHQFGTPFSQTSDVDVVIISEPLFYRGSRLLFESLDQLPPNLKSIRQYLFQSTASGPKPEVPLENWRRLKEAIRNFVYENLNPGLFPNEHPLRIEIFGKISGTAGLFLALEPKYLFLKSVAESFAIGRPLKIITRTRYARPRITSSTTKKSTPIWRTASQSPIRKQLRTKDSVLLFGGVRA